MPKRNLFLASAAGVLAFAAILVFGVPGVDPSLWGEITVAAGLRPPQAIFPGLWRILTGWLFSLFGVAGALGILKFAGAAVGGICAALVFLIVRKTLALLVRTGQSYPVWTKRIAPFFSFVAAVLVSVSDPFGRMCRFFSPDELRFAIFLLVIYLTLRWFVLGGKARVFILMTLAGFLAAETPFGFLLPLLFVGFYFVIWHCVLDGYLQKPENLIEPTKLPKWRMLFLFMGGVALIAWANVLTFRLFGGVKANGWNPTHLYFLYAASYGRVLTSAASPLGWILGFGFCVIPLVVAVRILPRVLRDDRPMPFVAGALLLFVGLVGLMQSGALQATRFWTFSKEAIRVESDFLLLFFVLCAVMTVAMAGAAFAFECQRTYLSVSEDVPRPGPMLRGLVPALACLVVALAILPINKPIEREMQRIVDAAVEETVTECENAKWIFTDGRLDAGLEIEAARRKLPLKPLNMMSGGDAWSVTLCTRGFDPESEDYKAAATGIPSLLRMWAGEKPNGMDEAALQLGFEFWKREQKALPKASGLVARTLWADEQTISNGVARADELAKRILAVSPHLEEASPSPALASAFVMTNWRLSRFARLREDFEVADELDQNNGILKKMLGLIEQERMRTFMQMTPREGLKIALSRADFSNAQRYAAVVLDKDEEDPEANFAMGMRAAQNQRYAESAKYLKICLKRRPEDPAVLNNLSIVCRKLGAFKESVEYARKAAKILPDSPEVKRALQEAEKYAN